MCPHVSAYSRKGGNRMKPTYRIVDELASKTSTRIIKAGKLPTGQTLDVALPEAPKISPAEYRRRSKATRKKGKKPQS
jgi:hypothetical protein